MKKLLISGVSLFILISLGAQPGQMRTTGTMQWEYPTNLLSTNMVFKLYSHTNLAAPLNTWPVVATVWWTNTIGIVNKNGTNCAAYQSVFPVVNAQQFFTVTASNWHGESDFSAVASTPPPPRSDTLIRLGL